MEYLACSHCQTEFHKNMLHKVMIDDEEKYFCCNGCELAYTLLKENNLESFYEKIGNKKLNTKEISNNLNHTMNYNSINFKEKYLVSLGNNLKEVNFYIDGIICAACIWLNERIISQIEGVQDIKINYTTHKAKIIFDENITSFSTIADKIFSIGYSLTVFNPSEVKHLKSDKSHYIKLVIAIFCSMNVMWVNVGQYVGFFHGIDQVYKNILNFASFILASPVLFYCASDFYKSAFKGLKNKMVGMDLLVISGTTIVYFYSIYAWLLSKNETYFESVCMIITFVLGAKTIENIVKKNANNNLDRLNSILPLEARLKSGELISVNDINENDELLVLPGEMIACDGVLISQSCLLDYSNINGESLEVSKSINQTLQAGSICINHPLIYRATSTFKDSSISKLAKLLQDSSFSTPKIAKLAFKISSVFSKIVLAIALIGFLSYIYVGSDFSHALLIAISVIIIACPCALALATPIASIVGLNKAFKNNIVFTQADFLETLAKVDTVVFDKTGTLTNGVLIVDGFEEFETIINYEILQEINLINPHKISLAINNFLSTKNISNTKDFTLSNFSLFPGLGFKVDIKINNKYYEIQGGSNELFPQFINKTQNNEKIIFILGFKEISLFESNKEPNYKNSPQEDFQISYIFYFKDSIKEGANNLIKDLQLAKKEVILLSGDRMSVVKTVAKHLNIKSFYANKTPILKAEFIKNLIDNQKTVAMIGDGLNDSLALDYAHIGIAMGSGSEISIAKSNVIILDDKLSTLATAFKISRSTLRSIKQNLSMSIIYNALAIPFALAGLVIPLFAALFMSLSSLCVVLNSMRQNMD